MYVAGSVRVLGCLTKTLVDKLVVFDTLALTAGEISHPNIPLSGGAWWLEFT